MRLSLIFAALAMPLGLLPMTSEAIEEPSYTVTNRHGEFEERLYAPYLVAEVTVPGTQANAGNQGFRILANYIFGKNRGAEKLPMTAPVTQIPASTSVPMAAPVTESEVAGGGYVVQFVMPRGMTLDTAPVPVDSRIRLRLVDSRRVAVIRYSGWWTESNYNEHLERLKEALRSSGQAWTGEPVYARYDAPFVPWFARRNEIWLTLK